MDRNDQVTKEFSRWNVTRTKGHTIRYILYLLCVYTFCKVFTDLHENCGRGGLQKKVTCVLKMYLITEKSNLSIANGYAWLYIQECWLVFTAALDFYFILGFFLVRLRVVQIGLQYGGIKRVNILEYITIIINLSCWHHKITNKLIIYNHYDQLMLIS
jgi:hypothetical protein